MSGFPGQALPGSSRPTVLLLLAMDLGLVAQCAANNYWDLFHLDLKTAFLQGEHYNTESRSVIIQLPNDIGFASLDGRCLSSTGLWVE